MPQRSVLRVGLLRVYLGAALLGCALSAAAAPSASAASCGGKLAALQRYAGSYDSRKLLAEPAVAGPLATLLGAELRHLERNLGVLGPIALVSCDLVLSGNAEVQGGEEDAILDIHLYSGTVVAAIHSHGRVDVYAADADYLHLPVAVRDWLAVVATGFRYRVRPPTGVRLLPPRRRP